jgi:hypothetical protein
LSARTRSGRVRGRPAPVRGTRIAFRTGSNCGESPRCPAVMTIDIGFCPCSTARCSLVVRPPRERPRPWSWSSGSVAMPPGGSFCRSPFSAPRRRAGGPGRRLESTLISQVIRLFASAWTCSSIQIPFQAPSRCQRRNRSYTRPHGPYRSGISRHGVPVRVRQRMPSISCRLVHTRGRPGFLPPGSSGSSRAHYASVRSPRATNQDHPNVQDPLPIHALGGVPWILAGVL